jgi:hypothetical protein
MFTKTLNASQVFHAPAVASKRLTSSIAPASTSLPGHTPTADPIDVESFLEDENPIGCIRGVFWVMGFNAVAFLIGFTVWATCKYLW